MDYAKLLTEAYDAASFSPDPSNQNGALLVNDDGKVLMRGFNHIVGKADDELLTILANRDEKMKHISHAEEIVIDMAACYGIKTRGLTMICPWAACMPCARSILVAGIKTLVVHEPRQQTTPERWQSEVVQVLAWLNQCGVVLVKHLSPLPRAPKILANGVMWQP
jgi:deoxycytidylate deaminase